MSPHDRQTFKLNDGWPPDGELGDFFGFDAAGIPAVLRWNPEANRWMGLRFRDYDGRGVQPEGFFRAPDTENYVVKWTRA
jgi:hypothetical protein